MKLSFDHSQMRGRNGRFLTEALFFEQSRDRTSYPPLFTLKPEDHAGLPSLKKIYLEIRDPTEYEFSQIVFGSWQHWQTLCALDWFSPLVEEWRKELRVALLSDTVHTAVGLMNDSDASASVRMQAARYIAERGWEDKPSAGRGRPSDAKLKKYAEAHAERKVSTLEDYKRIKDATSS